MPRASHQCLAVARDGCPLQTPALKPLLQPSGDVVFSGLNCSTSASLSRRGQRWGAEPLVGTWVSGATLAPADNLWSAYADKGAFVEKKGVPSVAVPEEARARGLPYVLTDIMTYFTMLVGIYFPSVTGEAWVPGV